MAGRTSTPGASIASRIVAVLNAFDETHRRLGLTELARRAGLPITTTHRICLELVELGVLGRRESGEFVIGRRVWNIGLLAPVQTGLRELASPFLHDIYAATRATVHLAVRDRLEVLYLDRLSGHESVPVVSRIGSSLPLHCTGVGKVLLAHAPPDVLHRVAAAARPMTPFTVVDPAVLTSQLERVRRDGFATTVDEMTLGASSVAVPVIQGTPDGPRIAAALGIVVAHLRRDRPRLVAALKVAAEGIGRTITTS